MSDKLTIANEMKEFDLKNRDFYTDLNDEEKKKFSNFLMIRWGSSVQGSRDLQEFYVISTNERLNKHFFAINKHPQLQWLCASSVSPGMGTHRHQWISPKKKDENSANAGTKKKQLLTLFPNMKGSDADVLSKLISQKDLDEHYRLLGQDTKK
jgi:hypothetical protein